MIGQVLGTVSGMFQAQYEVDYFLTLTVTVMMTWIPFPYPKKLLAYVSFEGGQRYRQLQSPGCTGSKGRLGAQGGSKGGISRLPQLFDSLKWLPGHGTGQNVADLIFKRLCCEFWSFSGTIFAYWQLSQIFTKPHYVHWIQVVSGGRCAFGWRIASLQPLLQSYGNHLGRKLKLYSKL